MAAVPDVRDDDRDAEVDGILADTIEELLGEGSILFLGEKFAIREQRSAMAMMTWFDAVDRGVKLNTVEGYKFILGQLKATIAPEDWARFEAHAMATEADVSQLNKAMDCGIAVVVDRPTQRPADSSTGPPATDPSSSASSSSPGSSTLDAPPSPRALQVVQQAAEMRTPEQAAKALTQTKGRKPPRRR